MTAKRIGPRQAHEAVEAGALLVCAYDDDQKCMQNRLEGALTLSELRAREKSLRKDQQIVFYCA